MFRTLTLMSATVIALGSLSGAALAQAVVPANVTAAVADAGRPAEQSADDAARMPAETITFAMIEPGDVVAGGLRHVAHCHGVPSAAARLFR